MSASATHPVSDRPTVLLVEDEILIADRVARYLERDGGYAVSGPALDVPEARALFASEAPDLVLLDIRLAGSATGIDFAHWLRSHAPQTPFVYLTSQFDADHLARAKATFPAGYLTKPIQSSALLATVAVVLHRHDGAGDTPIAARTSSPTRDYELYLTDVKGTTHHVAVDQIAFLRADHVYVEYYLVDEAVVVERIPLREAFARLPDERFAYVHRSYVVNLARVSAWSASAVTVAGQKLSVSRARRAEVAAALRARAGR